MAVKKRSVKNPRPADIDLVGEVDRDGLPVLSAGLLRRLASSVPAAFGGPVRTLDDLANMLVITDGDLTKVPDLHDRDLFNSAEVALMEEYVLEHPALVKHKHRVIAMFGPDEEEEDLSDSTTDDGKTAEPEHGLRGLWTGLTKGRKEN